MGEEGSREGLGGREEEVNLFPREFLDPRGSP